MKRILGFCFALAVCLSSTSIFAQQFETKVLKDWELVRLPVTPPNDNSLLGSMWLPGGPKAATTVPAFNVLTSIDLDSQKIGNNNIGASASIFSFLTGNFKKADAKFQLTKLPGLKIYQVKDVPAVLESWGRNSGKIITGYIVSDSFTVCSDKISQLIMQGSTVGGIPDAAASKNMSRYCQDLSKAALASVTTGGISVPKPPIPLPPIDPAKADEIKKSVAEMVVNEFNKLGLQNIAATVDLQNQTVSIATSAHPVMIAWQLVKWNPSQSSTTKYSSAFSANSEIMITKGNKNIYKINVGRWNDPVMEAKEKISPLCVYLKITDMASNSAFIPKTYCPQPNEISLNSGINLTGYIPKSGYDSKLSIPVGEFLQDNNLVKIFLTLKQPAFSYLGPASVTASMTVDVEEVKSRFKLVSN